MAEALSMDPIELRMRNLACDGSLQTTDAAYPPGVTILETSESCAKAGFVLHLAIIINRNIGGSNRIDAAVGMVFTIPDQRVYVNQKKAVQRQIL